MPLLLIMRRLGWLLLALFALAACAPAAISSPSIVPATATTAPPATQPAAPSGGLIAQPTAEPTPTPEVLAAAAGLPSNKPAFLDSFADW